MNTFNTRTIMAADVAQVADAGGPEQTFCGRVTNVRRQGGACFLTVQDASGRTQLFGQRNALGERYEALCSLAPGDMVSATGSPMRTRAGEPSLLLGDFSLAGRAYDRPPLGQIDPDGERHNALSDVEERRRHRHLDLMSDPETMQRFVGRSRFLSALRRYLEDSGYMEVETPVLQDQATGATARTFDTLHHEMGQEMQLRIALEIHLKLCLMGGMERVYELGRVFRNEGVSSRHNPEFTLLEMYAAWCDLSDMMVCAEDIVRLAFGTFGADLGEFRTARYGDLLAAAGGSSDEDFDRLVSPSLVEPTFVTNYPLEISPLAAEDPLVSGTAQRFELYVGGMEVANAYTELNDAEEQRRRLERADGTLAPMDARFVAAMRNGMPPAGGLGIGVDRLVMLASGVPSIRDVVLFPAMRNNGGQDML